MNFQYFNPVQTFFGEGCVTAHPEVFRHMGSHALIVTGQSSRRNGSLADVTAVLDAEHIPFTIYDKVCPNPTVASVRGGAEVVMKKKNIPNCLVVPEAEDIAEIFRTM